jgi:small subunit ribosomal protein S17
MTMAATKQTPAGKAAAGAKAPAAKAAAPAAKAPEAPKPAAPAAKAPEATAEAAAQHKTHSFRRKMVGVVTSDKMSKTVVVEVNRYSLDPVYKKYVKRRSKYKAHDEQNQYKVGDRVEIQEHRPLSREKRFAVVRLVARAVTE